MRVDIGYKFIVGIIIVVGSTVFVDRVVPYLMIPDQWQHLFSIAVALLIGLTLGSLFSRSFSRNIQYLIQAASNLANGDLRQHIRLRRTLTEDETADLAQSLDNVAISLRKLVGRIHQASTQVAEKAHGFSATSEEMSASATEVANASEQISIGAEEQMRKVETATETIRKMAEDINHIATSAGEAAQSASRTLGAAESGDNTVQPSVERLKKAFDEVEKSGHQMLSFGVHVQQIGKITEVITGVAEKTGLMALNATIEATRAGEYGRGFAMLAEEIGKLSDSTATSAADIAELIRTLQQEALAVQASMQKSIGEIETGRTALDTTSDLFGSITGTASESRQKASIIATLAHHQTEGAKVMVDAMEDISQIIQNNAASTEEVSAATMQQSESMEILSESAQELTILSTSLMEIVEHFKLVDQSDEEFSL